MRIFTTVDYFLCRVGKNRLRWLATYVINHPSNVTYTFITVDILKLLRLNLPCVCTELPCDGVCHITLETLGVRLLSEYFCE